MKKIWKAFAVAASIALLGSAFVGCKSDDDENVSVTGVSLDWSDITFSLDSNNESKSFTLTPTVSPSNASDKSVEWTTENVTVATVTEDGNVTAVATGTTIVTVTTKDGGKTATCNITVTKTEGSESATVKATKIITAADGTETTNTKTVNADNSTTVSEKVSNTDGTATETSTTTYEDNSTSISVTTTNADGSSSTITTDKDSSGSTTGMTKTTVTADGKSSTESLTGSVDVTIF